MGVRKGQELEIEIERTAHGGAGVARVDGFVVFVRGGIPGDLLRVRVYRKKKGYAEARVLEVLKPSPDRIPPPCPYSGTCGGCTWQHVNYERQLAYKRSHVLEAVERIGGLEGVPVYETLPTERVFGYRNKMEFSFSDRRWLLPEELDDPAAEQGFALGLHVPGTFNKIIDVEACLLQAPRGNDILGEVKAFARKSGLSAYGIKSHQGFWRFLTLRHSVSEDQWMVNAVTSEHRPEAMEPLTKSLHTQFPEIRTVVNNINTRRAAIAVGEREHVYAGDGVLEDHIGPYRFRISAASFFQTNTRGAETLYRTVTDYAGLTGSETVLDLYSGTGTIAIFLSPKARQVIGAELVRDAVEDAEQNCATNGVSNCRFIAGDLRETLSDLDRGADVLVIDPPRAGMHKDVLAGVLERACERVVYVSCNPATLARDLGVLSAAYRVEEIQPVDMFPHTYHVEAVARLNRK
ncbi:MAG: 23S rRNA (uracil(1939)-C(5))-methyltransferase RlmD [Desulfobacteraceae bacterium]|jgi:23S rRNA (uracil1939-C5)-methyltransferase